MFELSETPGKADSDKNEMLVRVKAISSWGNITKWMVEQTKEASSSRNVIQSTLYFLDFY